MTYEIVPVSNGYILRLYTVQPSLVGYTTYKLGRTLSEELVYPTLNALIADLKVRLGTPA